MTLDKIEALLASGACHSVYVGQSVVKGNPRFATITTGSGETVARGKGATATAALEDALDKLHKRPVTVVTQPAMPGFTRNAMPGFGAK
jgi:diaminopimelate epimerase